MSSWTPPELQKKKQDSTAWKPPELDAWRPPAEVFENHPSKITETWKLKELKSQGQKLTEQQERLLWEEEENRPILDRAVGYVKEAAKGIAEAVPPIAEGSVELFKKGIAKPIYALPAITAAPVFGAEKQKVYGTPYTREEGKKIYEDMILAWRSFGAGVARDAEEMSNAIIRGAMFGTGITDAMMGIDKEERFRSYMNRENMRELERAAAEDQPDRMAALLADNWILRSVVDVALKMQGVDEESRKAGVEEYTRLVQESGLTKEQLDEQIMAAGEFFSPVAIPGYNRITSKLAQKTGKIVEEKTGKILSEVVAPVGSGIEATGRFVDRTGKAIQTGAAELGRKTVDDPDTLVKSAVNTVVMPIRPPAKGAERFGALVKDIARQAKMNIAGRKGIIQRAGEDELSSQLTKRLFGAQGWGGVARAKTADWMLRQGAAIAQPAVNGGVLNLAMGLPDAETAEQGGYMFGYGMGIGGLAGTRLPDRAMALVDPTTSGAEKISRILTPDFNQRRLDEDADIRRFLAKSSPEFQQKMADFANIENRKAALDAAIAEQKAKLQSSIGKDETAWLQSYIKNLEKHRAALENSTPETEQELLRQVQLTFIDAFDQAQMSASASGLNDFNIVVLENSNIENFYRKLYGETLTNAENVKNSLIGKPNLSQQDAQALMQADEVINRFNRDIENAANSRGFAIQEDSQDPNNENYQPDYRRRLNQKGATVVINGDLVKNLNHRGFDLRRTVMHELYHGLSKFKEVQDMQRPLRQYLFDQMLVDERGNQIYDEKGEPIVASDGIYSEADLMLRAAFYARQFSPNNPQEFFAQFGGNKKKMLAYVKEEIVSELGGFAGDYDNGSRAALDDIGRTIMDWAEINTRNGYLKKAKEALRQKGVIFDKYGAFSDVLGAEMHPEQLAMFRVFQRNLRDMQSSLTYNRSQEKIENDIPWTKVMNSRVLQERNKDTGIFETKPILKITTPDGKITEVPIPENAQLNPFIDVYVAKNGLIVDADGNPIQDLPAELLSSLPLNDGTKFELDTTIVRDVTGKPIVISPAEMKSRALNRTRAIVDAMQTAPKDDSGVRMEDTGNGNFRGIMSPSQVAAVMALPNSVVAPKLKRLIKLINDILARKDGTRIFMEYQASLLKGKYKALSPRFRDEIPIGFQVSKDGNFLVTTISVSRMYDKAEAWASKKPENLKLWDNDLGRFWDSVMKVLQNHAEGKVGETGLDDDPERAREKKNAVNDLFNLYNADTKALNPRRTTLPRVKGKDPMDRVIAARRLDRINAFEESVMQKMPVNYGKMLENYLPAYNPMATPQTPEEFMQNTGGSVTASEIRNAIKNGEVEQLELELRNSDDIRPFETLIIEQNEAGEPTLRIDSTINPENASFFEEDEVVLDVNAETEQQIAQIRAEQIKDSPDAVDSDILQGQNNIPTQELLNLYDQQSLDEKSAKLPDAKITLGKDTGGDPLFAVATPEGKYIGTLGFAIAPEGRPDAIRVDMFRINAEYANQGYEEAVLRELAKYAQAQGITTLYSERVQPEKVKEFQNLFPTTATRPYYGQPQERDIVSEVDMTTQYMPAGSPEQFAQSQSEEYGLEAGQQAEMRLTPKTLFNLYWIMTEPEPNNEYGKSIRKEYIDRYTNLYKNVFKDLVRKQIEKYINRGRVDPEVTKAALSSANSAEDLEKLMRGTYRSDMKRRNDVWNIAAEHLTNLEKAQTPKDKLFYMDRLNNSIHNTQELLFSKFANAGSLMTAFDRIAAAKSTAAYRNFVDKDLREADSFGGTAYLPAVNYTIPKDPRMLMADFYLLTTADIANIFANPLEKKGGVAAAEKIKGLRYEEYLANLNEAIDTLSDQAQQHMKDALLFSVSAELRHLYVNSQPDRVKPLMEHPFMQKYKEIYDAYKFLSETKPPKYMDTYVESIQPESRAARITKGSNDNYRRSYAAVRKAMEETGVSLAEVATIAEKLFREGRWSSSYGGDPWGNISEGLRNVTQAKTRAEKIKAIDDAYALQHNTGKALNKLKRYMRAGSYAWLDQMLDFKYHALSPREFMPLTSLAAMKIAAPALIDIGFPAKDGMRRNLIEKTSPIFVEEVEKAVNKLAPYQEDIYTNIGVTAKKGTGRDINAELIKWLTKQLTSHYGAGTIYLDNNLKDAVPYVRVLLAEKMAWKPQLPPDIQASFEKLKKEEAEAKAEAQAKAAMIVPTSWETIAKLPPSEAQTRVKNWKQYWVNWLGYNVFRKAPAEAREKFANMLLDIIFLIDENGNIQITNQLPDMIINQFEYPNNLSIVKHVPDSKRPIGYKKIAEYIDTIKSEAEMLAMKIAETQTLAFEPSQSVEDWKAGLMMESAGFYTKANKKAILDAIVDPDTGLVAQSLQQVWAKTGLIPPPPDYTQSTAWVKKAFESAKQPQTKETTNTPKLKWEDFKPAPTSNYETYPNGDLVSGATVPVWVDGVPKTAFIVVHHGGTTITLGANQQYAVQWGAMNNSLEQSKKELIDQISGKYDNIVEDLREDHGVNLSFVDPSQTKSPQMPATNAAKWHEVMMQKWKASKSVPNKNVLFSEATADKILDAIVDPITGAINTNKNEIFKKAEVNSPPPQATNTWAWIEQAIQTAWVAKSTAEQAAQNAPTAKSAEEKWKNEWMAKGLTPLTDTQKSKILDAMIGAVKANSDQYLFKKLENEQLFGNEKGLDLNDLYVNDTNSYQWVSQAWFSAKALTGNRVAESKIEPKTEQKTSKPSKSTEFPRELEWLSPDEKTYILQTIDDALSLDLTANEWLGQFKLYGKTADDLYSPTAKQYLKELYLQKQGELVKIVKEVPAKLKFLNPALLQDLKERLDMVYRLKLKAQAPFEANDINKVVNVWETINWQTKPKKLSAVELDEIYAYAYDYVSKLANPIPQKSTNLADIPAPSAEPATPESTLKDIPAYTEAPQLYAYTDMGTPLVENAIKKAVMDYGGEMQKQDIIDFLNSDKKYSSIAVILPDSVMPAIVSFAKDYAAWIYTASPAEFDAEKRTVDKTLDSELSAENAPKTQWKDLDTTSVTAIETPNGTQYTKQGQPLPVMSFSNGQFPISTPFEIYDTFGAEPEKFKGTAVAGGFLNPDGETKTNGVLFYAKDPKDGEPFWWAYPLSIMDEDLAGEMEQLTLDQNQSWEEKFNELLMNPQSDLYDAISGLGEYSFSPTAKPQTAEPAPTTKDSGPKKESMDNYSELNYEFDKAIDNYANDYWDQTEGGWLGIARKMFDRNLFANDQTISVADQILVPFTSSSNELFILHGKENENKTGYTMDGTVEFGPIGSKPKEELMRDIADWLGNYIEFYENKI